MAKEKEDVCPACCAGGRAKRRLRVASRRRKEERADEPPVEVMKVDHRPRCFDPGIERLALIGGQITAQRLEALRVVGDECVGLARSGGCLPDRWDGDVRRLKPLATLDECAERLPASPSSLIIEGLTALFLLQSCLAEKSRPGELTVPRLERKPTRAVQKKRWGRVRPKDDYAVHARTLANAKDAQDAARHGGHSDLERHFRHVQAPDELRLVFEHLLQRRLGFLPRSSRP